MSFLDKSAAVAALSLTALIPTLGAAQTVDEQEIVVTAPLEGARIESLQGAAILHREDVIATLSGGLGDTLDRQPGISTTFFGAAASRPIIRGLGEDRVRVLQNGIGTIDASTASPDHAVTSDGLDAERIEVLRGAAALAYGGNAIGGVVNVIDQSIPTRAIDGLRFSGLAAYSTVDGGRHGAANIGVGAGDVAFDLSVAARETDSYDTPDGEALNQFTSHRSYSGGAALVGEWGFSGLAVKRVEDEYGLLPHHEGEPGGRIELEQTRIETRGDFRVELGAFDRFDYGFQHSDYVHTEFEGDGEPGTQFTAEGWEGRLEAHHRAGSWQGAIGLQISDADFAAEGEEAFISATNTRDAGVFVIERLDFGGYGFEGGARFEQRELENELFGERLFDTFSASVGAFVRPAERWFIGATLASTERAPTAIELFSDGPHLATESYEVGDPDLGQEAARSFEASARYDGGRFSFEGNAFVISFSDYIALVQRGDVFWLDEATETSGFAPDESDPSIPIGAETLPVFHFVQDDATFIGGELVLRAHLFDAGGFAIGADGVFDVVRATFDGAGDPPRIPPRTLTLGVTAESEQLTARLEVVDTAEQDRLAPFETVTDGFTFVNAGLAFRPDGEASHWSVRVDARNLTDEEGRVHSSFLKDDLLLPGRNFRLTVLTEF
ncbi:MAG: TonB-dependent receptor [Hyphomonadaceae bacterium]|nr:TonB-dependent receptor [Hyphomonadaceae bacterium]